MGRNFTWLREHFESLSFQALDRRGESLVKGGGPAIEVKKHQPVPFPEERIVAASLVDLSFEPLIYLIDPFEDEDEFVEVHLTNHP